MFKLFKKESAAPAEPVITDPIKAKWVARYREPQIGHAVEAIQAVDQSMGEAKAFLENDLIHPGDVVLDVGSGNGRQAIGLLEAGIKSYSGVEPMKVCVDFARKTFADYPQVEFVLMDLKNDTYNPNGTMDPLEMVLPFPDEHFDAAVAGSLFTHLGIIPVCDRYLQEIRRVLKPNGKLFCSWFRSPPNVPDDDHERSVFKESDIITSVTRCFTIYHSTGGTSDKRHDQWCLYCRK